MKYKIQSIKEAFSMQPNTFSITKEDERSAFNPQNDIEKIELEVMDEETNIYVGYNFLGKKMFHYLSRSVNVHYL